MERIVLASSSPRRKEILDALSIPFVAYSPDLDESIYDSLEPEFRVRALAEAKAMAVGESLLSSSLDMPAAGILPAESSGQPAARRIPSLRLIIAADTLVVLGSGSRTRVIGKPSSVDEARSMLRLLQGKTHRVYSGLCLLNLETRSRETVTACTKIRFAPMSDREIESCLLSGEWQGAAGAYRIQGQASYYIEGIEGSWSCVVGLPIREFYGILCRAGYDFSSVKGA